MKIYRAIAITAFLSAASIVLPQFGSAADAQSTPSDGTQVKFCGTVVPLVESGCIGLNPAAGGRSYDITAARPRPAIGEIIEGKGRVHYVVGICMQGVPLADVTWRKATACPK